ncbi:MAG: UDP-N-acetylmuramate dehydrogenase [Bacteroidales bacterium]|nr:UDP-N-acetylmuramate dehydrogenase [Bacteroidales bacterium]
MNIYNNISLKPFNTFGIDVNAHCLVECQSISDIQTIAQHSGDGHKLVIGGGSNMLFMSDFNGIVIHPTLKGIEIMSDNGSDVIVRAGAGVIWDDFVSFCVNHNLHGVENLSGIPGSVGASPVQNVGAYGMEAGQAISMVNGFRFGTGEPFSISAADCHFGYRNSIFKNELKDQVIVATVDFHLKHEAPLNLDYGPVRENVEALGGASLANIRTAILNIRSSKLPDPKIQGNAGSFFKNPEVDASIAKAIAKDFPAMPSYALPDGRVKIPAGWLIEQSGWKGRSLGPAAVHSRQALVLVNNGGATGTDVMNLAQTIQKDVMSKFGITLSMEVCRID